MMFLYCVIVYICIHVLRTLFSSFHYVLHMQETLQSFLDAIESLIALRVSTQCTAPCSYSQQDVEIDSSWPQAGQPGTNCIASNATIGFRVTCSYRPRLNQTVHSVVQSVLTGLGNLMTCDNYRGSAIVGSVPIVQCTVPETTSVPLKTPVVTSSEKETVILTSPGSFSSTSNAVRFAINSTSVDIKTTSTLVAVLSSQQNPQASYSIGITNDNKSNSGAMNVMTILVMVFVAVILLLILLLIILASALLVVRKRAKRRKSMTNGNTKNR